MDSLLDLVNQPIDKLTGKVGDQITSVLCRLFWTALDFGIEISTILICVLLLLYMIDTTIGKKWLRNSFGLWFVLTVIKIAYES